MKIDHIRMTKCIEIQSSRNSIKMFVDKKKNSIGYFSMKDSNYKKMCVISKDLMKLANYDGTVSFHVSLKTPTECF